MQHVLTIDNLKCGGCAATITRSVSQLPDISDVRVDTDMSTVTFQRNSRDVDDVAKRLDELGYPIQGTASGLHGAVAAAKSYVSCAIGRVRKT